MVIDNLTGLMWAKNANATGSAMTWYAAITYSAITINASPGALGGYTDWRLPNLRELLSLIDYGHINPALSNTTGTGIWIEGYPFTGVQSNTYWSSTTLAGGTVLAWYVDLKYGDVFNAGKTLPNYVWPVRGGQ